MSQKAYFSPTELANLSLNCLPKTRQKVAEKAKRENWLSRQRIGRGGGFEYNPPELILSEIRAKQTTELLQSTTTTLPALPEQLPVEQQQLTERQP